MNNEQKEFLPFSFPYQIKLARIQRGWSQAKVAEELNIETKTVSRWECGDYLPISYLREKLSTLFNMSLADLGLLEAVDAFSSASSSLFDPAIPLPPANALVGREEQFSALRQSLQRGGNWALSGLPGVGKTAISVALANDPEIRATFCDGILWAGLGPTPNLLGHVLRWAAMLGASVEESNTSDIGTWSRLLHEAIGSRRMLIIIDDVWRGEDALQLQIGGPVCTLLFTTRFFSTATQLAAEGAAVVEELAHEEGIALLHTLAPRVVAQEPERISELVKAVGGLPLALILIGNYLRIQSYHRHPRRTAQAVQLLCSDPIVRLDLQESRSPAERHSSQPGTKLISLYSIISVSLEQLDRPAYQTLSALAAFPPKPNSFSEEAALDVADCTVELLDVLADAGLLQLNSANRYMLHPTIADFAGRELEDSGDFEVVNLRLVDYFTEFAARHSRDYEQLEAEYNNILAALEAAFAVDGVTTQLAHLACAFAPFLIFCGLSQLAETHLQRAYRTARLLCDTESQTSVLAALTQVLLDQGKDVNDILEETSIESSL